MLFIMKIGVSSASASVLGLSKAKYSAAPTTAYLILGGQCENACSFCPRGIAGTNKLSRVSWPLFEQDEVLNAIINAYDREAIKRVCIQTTDDKNSLTEEKIIEITRTLVKSRKIPVSISAGLKSSDFISSLFKAGASFVSIPLDAANEELYKKIKKKNFKQTLNFIFRAAELYPRKITTHIIAGLGENENEMLDIFLKLRDKDITIGLFAFTPLRGTEMAGFPPPPMEYYRKMQLLLWLIKNNMDSYFTVKEGIIRFDKKIYFEHSLKKLSEAFITSGCPDCNRPFYNERPGQLPYNYPQRPSDEKTKQAIQEAMGLIL